jgi:competence protein ComEC
MDEIREKLAQIDRQLAGRNFHENIISTSPLLFAAVGFISGILLQDVTDMPVWIWMSLLVPLVAGTIIFFILRQSTTYCRYILAYMALTCFVCLGAIRLTYFYQPKSNDIRNLVTDEPMLATIRGLIVTEPYINQYPDWKFAQFMPTDPSSSFYLKIDEVETTRGWTGATGMVRVQVDEPVLDLKAGDYVQLYCWLDGFEPPTNPGQFDTAGYLAGKNVFIGASVKMRDGIELLQYSPAGLFIKLKTKLRQAAARALLGDLQQEDAGRGLLQALLLGYRRDIDSETYQAFRKTGLLHFISLSGMHLGILMGIIWWLCKIAGLMKPARALICIVALAVFLLIVPARAPTLRAAVIVFIFCLSFFFRRHPNPINTLSLAAIILLLIRPTQLFEPGWQLSFAAVLGILIFTDKISGSLHENINPLLQRNQSTQTKPGRLSTENFADKVTTLFSIGLAAWLGGAGILLYHFYTVTPFAGLWTILVFPFVSAILTLGFFKMILFFPLPSLSFVLGYIITALSEMLIWIVRHIADLNISQILIGRISPALVIFYYGIILFAGYVYFRRPLIKKVILTTAITGMIIFLGVTKWQRTHRDGFILTCLDVGHGQAIFAQLPGRANVLFDAGSMYKSDIGRRIVAPFLDSIGTNRIDAVMISHNDTDHINGIPEIAKYCNVGRIYANDDFFERADQYGTAAFLKDCLNDSGFEIEHLSENLNLSDKAIITTLWPRKKNHYDEPLSDNDKSLVSLIEFAGRKILLCSDIEQFAQKELMQLYPGLKADIVVVPHHGSVNTLETDFLQSLEAKILVCSCSQTQYQGMNRALMTQIILPECKQAYYTYRDGAVTIRIEENGSINSNIFLKEQAHTHPVDSNSTQ